MISEEQKAAFRILYLNSDEDWPFAQILDEDENQLRVSLGDLGSIVAADGAVYEQRDYRVGGEVWQVHKGDADPFPSRPHAHCVGGRRRYIGCKLHLGTRELYHGRRSTKEFLHPKPFSCLIKLIQPKFPEIKLPLEPL